MTEHSPFPSPERAIFGFVLYLSSFVLLGVYIFWAYVPDYYLLKLGLTFFPQKYWAIAVPCFAVFCIVFLLIFYVGINFTLTPPLVSRTTFTDSHSVFYSDSELAPGAIAPLRDIPIEEVNNFLYT